MNLHDLIPPGRWRRLAWAAVDAAWWMVAVLFGCMLRYDFVLGDIPLGSATIFAVLVAALHALIGMVIGPYTVGHQRGSFEEVVGLAKTAAVTTVLATMANLVPSRQLVPRSVPLIAALVAVGGMFAVRMVFRSWHLNRPDAQSTKPIIVFGAGKGGRLLIRALLSEQGSRLRPVALLDDDPIKRRLTIDGVRVLGTRDELVRVAGDVEAAAVAIAVPSADAALISELRGLAKAAGIEVLVMPSTSEMLAGRPRSDLRRLDLADLLGRRPVELDVAAIERVVGGKTVLITGAGGSIGSELCRQIAQFRPGRLLLLDRDESALHATQLSLHGQALLDDDTLILADIRDGPRIQQIMEQTRPDIVFHAAALKHLPLLERYPLEAWKTNVLGTMNVLQAARDAGVLTFVNISTDKAANPICVLGYSKRLTERLTSGYAKSGPGVYVSVRFGNVLGSRGSVLTAFTAQIERGGPVTVTHPDVERYFMLIPEACQLVLQAAAIGVDGEVMVLDMGKPAKIVDVARTLIDLSGRRDVEIVFTGLRPGEKMTEELFSPGDFIESAHPLVSHVQVPGLSAEAVLQESIGDGADAVDWMREQATGGC